MDRIEEILNQRGLSKAAFAELMGTSRQNVNALLKNPTRAKLEDIAKVLDVPLWQLFASPAEVASQEFIAFFYHKGRTHTPTTMKEILDILDAWNKSELCKECHKRDFQDLREKYEGVENVRDLINELGALLCDKGHPGAEDYSNHQDENNHHD